MKIEDIARVCHETNRAYCKTIGDDSQMPWDISPEWQRCSAIQGVEFHATHPKAKPSDSHDSWLRGKKADGWRYGPVKDTAKKEHPCFVPYEQLPAAQQVKDALFTAVVRVLLEGNGVPHAKDAKGAKELLGRAE